MKKGKFLKRGHALTQYNRFKTEFPDFPFSLNVCYSLKELQDFIDAANDMFDKMTPKPAEANRGAAFTLGIHTKELADNPGHADDKITIMMVASIWENDTTISGRARACDNHVLRGTTSPTPTKGGFADVAYDAGSLYP